MARFESCAELTIRNANPAECVYYVGTQPGAGPAVANGWEFGSSFMHELKTEETPK